MNDIPHIFIAYARKDKVSMLKLKTHLNVLQRRNVCRVFFDGEIIPGERWDDRLKAELHRADIFVLLVSEDFLDSDYVNDVELPKILEKEKNNECQVIPVILWECLWTWTELGELQAVLDNDRPIEETKGYGKAAKAIAQIVSRHHAEVKKKLKVIEQKKIEAEEQKRQAEAEKQATLEKEKERKEAEAKRKKKEAEEQKYKVEADKIAALQKEKERKAAEVKRKKEAADRQKREKQVRKEKERKKATDPFHDLMIPIQGGTFQMGDEHGDLSKACLPLHQVTVKDFQLSKHPVTQTQWQAIMGDSPSHFKNCGDCPVEKVSWDDVQSFLKKF